ncbi:hypothetical protein P171DRAFT_436478 [Karstenula rhodostoma CBS 690.94]|uniref:Uncharacterized protein n=1 Tax=Karstenula rhodostoma CBS 690.94 TaxID=1392251 RepID=A0A9P4P8F3_9PLEO|nr:hypothetical protein P171DRAFT_436478 [Karstenula rhodostoma CBS 690.94]
MSGDACDTGGVESTGAACVGGGIVLVMRACEPSASGETVSIEGMTDLGGATAAAC